MDDVNDVSSEYMQVAQNRSQAASIEGFMNRMRKVQPAAEAGHAVEDAATSAAPATAAKEGGGILSTIGSAAKDLGRGMFMESPGAVAGGIYDAAHNTATGALHAWDDLAKWLDQNVANLQVGNLPAPGAAIAGMLPDKPSADAQESNTGKFIRESSRFLTGFLPISRGLQGAGMGASGASIVGGGLADMITKNPNDKNLSNLIQQFPALQNPVNEFLASDPSSPEALNRLRHGLEGLGLGAVTEGLTRGIRAIASSRQAGDAAHAQMVQQYGTLAPDQMQSLAGADAPLVVKGGAAAKLDKAMTATATGVPDDVAAKGLTKVVSDAGDSVYVNFARMSTPDDVQAMIKETAKAFKGEIKEAARGVQTNEQTKVLAEQLGMSVDDLLARRAGSPLSAEEGLAARRLWNTSAEKLLELAQKASEPNAGAVDLFNFRKMMAVHHAIQSEVMAARTETARALQAWSIPAGSGGTEMARGVQMTLDNMGGAEVTKEFARRFATLANQDLPPGALATVVRRGVLATSVDMVKESYVLGLLWNPSTHVVNAASNTGVAFQQVYERALASKYGDFIGSAVDGRVVDGEAIAMTYGMTESLHDAFRLASKTLRTGQVSQNISKIDVPEHAISAGVVSRELGQSVAEAQAFAEAPMGRFLDMAGTLTRLPGNALSASDEFFKTIAYRAEVHAQALRQATQEGLSGPDKWTRMAQLANDPPEFIRLAAADAALYATFQNKPGTWAQALLDLRSSGSLNPTFMVLPFIRTPANILRYTFERTPLAPLVKQWRDDVAAGGARQALAVARMASGTAIMAAGLDMASSGLITGAGPSAPAEREVLERQGWKPFSIVVNGKYYSYNRMDPFGSQLGFMATLAEKMKSKELDGEDFDDVTEAMAAGIATLSQSVVDKTYFRGVADVLSVIKSTERNDSRMKQYLDRSLGTLIPFSSALNVGKRLADPVTREYSTTLEAMQSRLPILSKELPPARDLWGKEKAPQEVYGRVVDVLSPSQISQRVDSPIDAEMERLRTSVDRIKRSGKFDGVDVSFRDFPEVYDYYVRLAGNELKHPAWGLGAKDYLDAVVTGKHPMSAVYNMQSDDTKAAFISNAVSEYRDLARRQILSEAPKRFPDFAEHIGSEQQDNAQRKLPAAMQGVQLPRRPAPPPVQVPLPPRTNAPGAFQVPR